MAENVTAEEIAQLVEFCRNERDAREFSRVENDYVTTARSALAIAEKLPALIAAAEEAEDSRPWVMFYRDGKLLGEIAEHFGTTIYAFSPWLAAPMMKATRAAGEDAFAAGKREGIEAATKAIDHCICDVSEDQEQFMRHRDYFATAIRALIEESKEKSDGEQS
jgi:hypothetical protein